MSRLATADEVRGLNATAKPVAAPGRLTNAPPPATALHPAVLAAAVGIYVYIMAVFWLLFGAGGANLALMLAICTVFLAMYVGTPYVMARVGGVQFRWHGLREFLGGEFETNTGPISGAGAAIQVLIVPAALAAAVTGIAFAVLRTM